MTDSSSASPDRLDRRDPADAGLDPDALADAIAYARLQETPPEQVAYDYGNVHPWEGDAAGLGDRIGPMPDRRGGQNGMVLKDGAVVAEWGDTTRADHTFSVAKSFLATVAGVAYDRGLIEDVTDPVYESIDDGGFDSPHNRQITWEMLFQQTSEWEGELFGKPDHVDRNRAVGKTDEELTGEGHARELREPGTFWEYNDVRINRIALSLLRLFEKPLPLVLKHEVMEPLGAAGTWEWHGYYNSDVRVGDRTYKSVSGGGHWGGGVWIATRDLARFGQLMLNGGTWDGKRLLSAEWVEQATTPCDVKPTYGYLWWLNSDGVLWPDAPESSYAAYGFGQNQVWVDPDHDLVAVNRWLRYRYPDEDRDDQPTLNGFYRRLLEALD